MRLCEKSCCKCVQNLGIISALTAVKRIAMSVGILIRF